mmetsp:Transcript_45615/g.97147  ORF Transcript_45615/g.97147 Transcript_45615/m.97147 type:complete len:106 (-) Transcript_45615:227-544(-)
MRIGSTSEALPIVEHIYAARMTGEIRFVPLDSDGKEGRFEIVNAMRKAPLRVEYYQRDRHTMERVAWDMPVSRVRAAIEQTITLAREAASAEASDSGDGTEAVWS